MQGGGFTADQVWRPIRWLKSGWQGVVVLSYLVAIGLLVSLSGCRQGAASAPRRIVLQQTWELEAGDTLAGHLIVAGLGDISIQLNDHVVRAPFAGRVELAAAGVNCIYFSTPEIPAYLFRYCGIRRPRLGSIRAGAVMGVGDYLHFATLRRLPDGTWAIVEPSGHVLEKSLHAARPWVLSA